MKQQSLIGLIASFAVLGSSSIFQSKASAEPHRIFNTLLPQLERRTRVPILLPRELPQLLLQRSNSFYLHLEKANANGYEISILTDPNCRGANVCFLGSLSAERISSTAAYASPSSVRELQSQANVSLRGGIKGFFEPLSCGGSCSPPNLRWVYQGVLYEISLRTSNENSDTQRSILVAMASSSLPETSQPTVARSPSSGQQMGTGRVSTPRQVYRNVRELGMAQFLGGNRELIDIQQEFKLATQGQYQTINIPKAEFLEKKITDRMGSGCVPLAPCPDEKKISYADYLKLKLKLDTQAQLYNKRGVNIFEAIDKYKSRLERERLYGGQSVASKLVSLQSEANQQVQRQRQQRDSRVSSVENIFAITKEAGLQAFKLGVVTAVKFHLDMAPAYIRASLRPLAASFSQLESTNLGQSIRNVDYVVKVAEILPKSFEAFLDGKDNELRNFVLEMGAETAALVESNRLSGGLGISPHAAKAIESYQKIQKLEKLREDLDRLRILDERDKSYIDWTIKSFQWDLISSVVSVLEDIFKSAGLGNHPLLVEIDNYHKASDSIKSAFSNASDAASQQKLRFDYQLLLTEYEKNQIVILAFSSFVDSAAEEVGRYLVSVRTDVVTRRSDGTITVSTDGVLYPP